ncbi:MAG: thiamine phosphate synthase [Pseudomonadota bacterium]|nr:thiamine phosphate synthase [Pseudomonadota bacterium]
MLNQRIQGLYGITPDKDLNIGLIENAIKKHNIKILQYRRKAVNIKNKAEEAKKLLNLCLEHHTLFIVNDDVNLCEKVGANGIHIGQGDMSAKSAREALGDKFIIGVTCHNSLELAIEAEKNGANYIALGAIFKSKNKPKVIHCPLSKVEEIKKNISIPIVGIGGINLKNQHHAYQAGCSSVAMIDGLFRE